MRQFKPYPPHRSHHILLARMVLDNRIVFYQISAEKGDICCDQSPHYVYINVTSEVKIYLDRSTQLVT